MFALSVPMCQQVCLQIYNRLGDYVGSMQAQICAHIQTQALPVRQPGFSTLSTFSFVFLFVEMPIQTLLTTLLIGKGRVYAGQGSRQSHRVVLMFQHRQQDFSVWPLSPHPNHPPITPIAKQKNLLPLHEPPSWHWWWKGFHGLNCINSATQPLQPHLIKKMEYFISRAWNH